MTIILKMSSYVKILRCVSKYVKDALAVCCQPVRRSSPVCAHSILSFCVPKFFFSRIFAFLEGNVLLSRISRSCSAYRKQTPSVIKQSLSVFLSFLLPSDESEIMKSNSPPPTNCYQWEIFSVAGSVQIRIGIAGRVGGGLACRPSACLHCS